MPAQKDIDISNLVAQVKAGNQESFAVLYDNYSDALYGVAWKILNSEDEAQDVLQDSFIKIWKKINSFDENKGTIFTWMLNIVRNSAIDQRRKLSKFSNDDIQNLSSSVNYVKENGNEIKEDHIGLLEQVDNLESDHKLIIDYIYYRGYTQQEVSDELGIPLGTVKSRTRKAVENLRKAFISILLFWI